MWITLLKIGVKGVEEHSLSSMQVKIYRLTMNDHVPTDTNIAVSESASLAIRREFFFRLPDVDTYDVVWDEFGILYRSLKVGGGSKFSAHENTS